mmetsp:Transcript_69085/g.202271  ORF Transcript_69085/g.202271 Transcript_69085/m.202271 type:complete len:282 (+) Transcript_69085:510-1355(+)
MQKPPVPHHHRAALGLHVDGWWQLPHGAVLRLCQDPVRAGNDQRAAIHLIGVLENVGGVKERGGLKVAAKGPVVSVGVLVHRLWVASRVGAVGQEAVADPASAQSLVQDLLDQRASLHTLRVLLNALHEALALVHQPVHVLARTIAVRDAGCHLALSLLQDTLLHARVLLGGQSVLNEAVAPRDDVVPHLVQVLGRFGQILVLPVDMLSCHSCVPVALGPVLRGRAPLQRLAIVGGAQPWVVLHHGLERLPHASDLVIEPGGAGGLRLDGLRRELDGHRHG